MIARSLFVSDLHLGFDGGSPERLLSLLRSLCQTARRQFAGTPPERRLAVTGAATRQCSGSVQSLPPRPSDGGEGSPLLRAPPGWPAGCALTQG